MRGMQVISALVRFFDLNSPALAPFVRVELARQSGYISAFAKMRKPMKSTTPTFVIELPLRVNDQQNRFLTQAFEFGRTLYNATLGTALGQLQRMRESKEWRETRDMPKGKKRSKRFSELQRTRGLTEYGLKTIANNHRKASGRNDIGAHEAQCIGRMEAIAADTGCSIVFLHHASKGAAMMGAGDQQQASRGSSVLVDNIRWQSYLSSMTSAEAEEWGVDDDQRRFFVRFGVSKANYGAPFADRWFRRHDGGVLKPAVLERQRKSKGVPRGEA